MSDVFAGLRLGEAVALDLLKEQRMLQTRYARRQFTRFDGDMASV